MIRSGDIVLLRTGWEERAGTPRFFQDEWPGFTAEAIEALALRGAKAVGGDICTADSPKGIRSGAPAHKAAARHGLPLRLSGCEAGPVRAVAFVE
jgi:kynurenine formamidase